MILSFLKKTRWLLVSNPENLSEKGKARLEKALEANQPLATVYYFKEKLRQLWSQGTKAQAKIWLDDWCEQANDSELTVLKKFAKTLRKHEVGIVKVSYGYRDWEFFELKVKASHEARSSFS